MPPKCPPLEERLKSRYVIMRFYSANKMSYIKRKKARLRVLFSCGHHKELPQT